MRFYLLLIIALLCAAPAVAQQGYFPFSIPDNLPAGCEIKANWIDAPAGKNGPVVIRDSHFYTGNERIRFFGVNLVWESCFPTKDEADMIANKLASFGVNLIRFHFLDIRSPRGLVAKGTDSRHIDPERLDRLDYFISRLKAHGIYADIGLHCAHEFTSADGVAEADKLPAHSKYTTLFDPRQIELEKEFAKQFFTHKNPYTGNVYAQEPAIAMTEITNENSVLYGWSQRRFDDLSPYYAAQLDKGFRDYLAAHNLPAAERPHFRDGSPNAEAYLRYLMDMENRYFTDMYNYLKKDLRVGALVAGTMAVGPPGAVTMAKMDYVDNHAYWEHPAYTKGDWIGDWTIRNTPMVAKPDDNTLIRLAAIRVDGKPYTVSEYNHPFPSFYDAEALPLAAAFAARQDWDALVIFDYKASPGWNKDKMGDFFEIAGHPVKTAEMLAASAMIVRHDISPAMAATHQPALANKLAMTAAKRDWWDVTGMLSDVGMSIPKPNERYYMRFSGNPIYEPAMGTDDAYKWTGDGKQGLMTADFAGSKAAVGFFDGKPIEFKDARLIVPPTFAAVMVTTLDGKPIPHSAQVLITACGRVQNTGMQWNDANNSLITWGEAPALAQGIAGRVELNGDFSVFALDAGGRPVQRLSSQMESGYTSFDIGPESRTLWYLAVRRP